MALVAAWASFEAAAWSRALPPEEQVTPVRLEFSAPEPCTRVDEFIEGVRRRSERIRFESVATKQLTISIHGRDANWTGRASFAQADLPPLSREINARSCGEVLEGLALVTVMVLDPDALGGSRQISQPSAPAAAVMTSAATPSPPKAPDEPDALAPVRTAANARLEFGLGGVLGMISGPAPDTMFGFGATAHAGWLQQHRIWSPEVRVTFTRFSLGDYATAGGTANFALSNFTLGLCPIAFRLGAFHAHPCVTGSAGQLTATGARTFVPRTENLLWVDVGGQIVLAWNPVGILALLAVPAVGFPQKRYAFSFTPHQFYEQPPVLVGLTAGMALQID